ncbi:MAG: SpoIIE family protein phosphatase [Deltaproteobacteria bacterium]|nr:SpoIIE family protein phosphatase [Deltaproteobacteria bacterium]
MNNRFGLGAKLALLILSGTTVIFTAAFCYNYYSSKEIILHDVRENARSLAHATARKIETILLPVEKVPLSLATALETFSIDSGVINGLLTKTIANNSEIFGTAIAFEPYGFDPQQYFFAPYCYRDNGQPTLSYLGSDDYRYFIMDWYLLPRELKRPVWSEPYYDEGGGNIIMSTYSVPFYRPVDGQRRIWGIATADVSLMWLEKIVGAVNICRTGYAFLISQNGVIVTHRDKNLIMRESLFSLAEASGDNALRRIGRDMVRGGEGFVPIADPVNGKRSWMYYAALPSAGWSLGVIFPEDELFVAIQSLTNKAVIIGLSGILILALIIVFISSKITRPLRTLALTTSEIARGNLDVNVPAARSRDEIGQLANSFSDMRVALKEYIENLAVTTAAKERIESELKIAATIQMSFLPKRFPPFPDQPAFDIYAMLVPAKQVGGDLYDFCMLDERHLFIAVGDVSDKGVPAALFMAVTKTLLKGMAELDTDLADVLDRVNRELCIDNESMMFVTLFCAVLDIETGVLTYSNAGHNPPLILRHTGEPEWLQLPKGIVLGTFEDAVYSTQQITLHPDDCILAYTDGVTEAMDRDNNLYSEERLYATAETYFNGSAEAIISRVMESVSSFSGGIDQSDDITLLAVTYKGRT